ncbi:MAG TPA: hypothetical protein VKZ18_13440 [Polyangia bacterium]|nr:hypothetical protein [Polyangia bacterium]
MRLRLPAGETGRGSEAGRFSLIERDPLFELQRAAHLCGGRYEVLPRALVLAAVGWLPPVVLSALAGQTRGALVGLHTRFLLAIPVLLWAESFVDQRVRGAIDAFSERGIVRLSDLPRFRAIVDDAERRLHATRAAIVIVAIAFGLSPLGGLLGFTPRGSPAAWWTLCLSLPLFRVVLLQWVWRWVIWSIVLIRTSRLDLRLDPTHPDLAGGLGFLEHAATSFLALQVAVGAVIAGRLLAVVLRSGDVRAEQQQVIGFALLTIVVTLGPLLPFVGHLLRAKRLGKLDYGRLATRHNQEFAERWLGPPAGSPLGDPSISSLADLGTSYAVIDRLRPLPVGRHSLVALLVVCAAPALPALAAHVPLREMLTRVVKTVLL